MPFAAGGARCALASSQKSLANAVSAGRRLLWVVVYAHSDPASPKFARNLEDSCRSDRMRSTLVTVHRKLE